ncbi:GTP-binding protein [Streptomyces daliensis]|uniref:TetM/TetW/TetO/TetS family tetracycline resistance ribosomal protection protein n=1 Tax=Streptomyces daliensis TaxID=299421 RepID=A0A8T4IQS2_9ACTN|nr:TetM/TetW/TetO/TetS family tetracycline resistance ribosomal protection protein [Streptomyces daliensis]
MRTLNLGILAHVDAGKTSLTERLLHTAGVIDEIGSVDAGSTLTDSLALERRRGITIKSAVVSFALGDVTVNLIDTPGHPDFIAEVERVLHVLDGAVLVVSAVEGVQSQTRVLMRTLRRLRIPTLVFVNKTDRRGARYGPLLRDLATKLTPGVLAMGTVHGLGTPGAAWLPYGPRDAAFRSAAAELLAEHDDALLAAYVEDETSLSYSVLRDRLAGQSTRALAHPVFFGSAITGAGVGGDGLASGITRLLPARDADTGAPVAGTVFKVEREPSGEKTAYVRLFSGTLRTRDRLRFGHDGCEGKVTALSVFDRGTEARAAALPAGRIGKVWGLAEVRVGDAIGPPLTEAEDGSGAAGPVAGDHFTDGHHFAPPTLETVTVPRRAADRGALHTALTQLAEQDPLINLRQDDLRQEISVSLYGEVQKEVIQATLAEEYGIEVGFRETTTICLERPVGTGTAVEFLKKDPNPFLATVGLRVGPAPVGSGVDFRLDVEPGSMPYAFLKAVEETVARTLSQGLRGWRVTDCVVTMTHSGYAARQSHAHAVFDKSMSSTAGDFRNLTPLVLMSALTEAGTRVHEPVHRFRLDIPADAFGAVLPVLTRLEAVPRTSRTSGTTYVLEGDIPAARVHALERRLPTLTSGEGVLEAAFDHYRPVRGEIPSRPRTDHNPLDRKEYLLHVMRRV